MKGISAMIATVLLIAFTVAVGGVMSIWMTGLTTTQQQQVSNQSAAQAKCTPSLQIERVDSSTPGLINVTVMNPSQQSITAGNITVIATNASVYSTTLPVLASGQANFTAVGWWTALPTLVRVQGLCASLPVSFTCKPADACWRGS